MCLGVVPANAGRQAWLEADVGRSPLVINTHAVYEPRRVLAIESLLLIRSTSTPPHIGAR